MSRLSKEPIMSPYIRREKIRAIAAFFCMKLLAFIAAATPLVA
jgi:hypothetical protein